jgi:FG-GAP repeat
MSPALLDAAYYSAVNPDLAAAGLKTERQLSAHFENFGLNEGRAFSPLVNLKYYQDKNPDLTAAGLTTFRQLYEHLQKFGIAEGRRFSPLVDLNFYLAANPDVNQAFTGDRQQAFNHLQQFGLTEGRQFSPWVDLGFYLAANPDISQVFRGDRKQALTHLQNFGLTEGRRFSPVVDLDFYLGDNSDLLQAFGRDRQRMFEHLQTYGIDEGRRFSLTFEPTYYRQVNSDLAAAKLTNKQLLQHFQIYGVNEGRSASEFFDLPFYRKINPDLGTAGLTNRQALQHFLLWGQAERRWPFDLFSNVAYLDANPDVKQAVEQGRLSSGFEHYFNFGGSEGRPIRVFPNPNPEAYNLFGSSVTTLGNNLLVGATSLSVGHASSNGTVYLFNSTTGSLLQTFQGGNNRFAYSVVTAGNNVLVGAPGNITLSLVAAVSGAAYLFDSVTGTLLQTFKNSALRPDQITPIGNQDAFGESVAAIGNNVLIADPSGDTVQMFDSVTGTLLQTFQTPYPERYGNFARAVVGVNNNVLIGVPNDDAYLFDSVTGRLLQTFHNPNPDSEVIAAVDNNVLTEAPAVEIPKPPLSPYSYDRFGEVMAVVGNNVLIGAPGEDMGATDTGAAYLFDSVTGTLLRTFQNPNPGQNDYFGETVAAVGNNVLIGAPGDDTGAIDAGAAYLFDGNTGVLLRTFQNPTAEDFEYFGSSLGALGNHSVIGIIEQPAGSNPKAGAVYLF